MRAFILTALVAAATAEVYFEETFGEGWEGRWVQSGVKTDLGKFVASAGKFYNDEAADTGIKTSEDAKFYGLSAKFGKFSNDEKTLVVQFRVKHEQNIDCGGGYVKIFPSTVEGEKMDGESPYNIMFGPDICGPGTRKVHVIFAYKGENHLIKKTIGAKTDEESHLYTLIVNSDNTYEVRIDGEKADGGSIYDDFDMLKPKEINNPDSSKPADWVDETEINDPEETKPEDWVTESHVTDPEAEKPEDWDDEMDGEWEAPQIENPEFKGDWKATKIPNPAYKGVWVHDQVANPDFVDDDKLYSFADFGVIGIDIWQVKAGSIFDDFLITDSIETAEEHIASFKELVKGESAAKKVDDDKKAAEAEAAAAAAAEAEGDEEAEEDAADEDEAPKEELKDEL